ncbi:MAG: helix-turn-helix transcriptional regulator [Bryobacterales bacterium]|nr:helix-turn-helix transcriptional regulator [Bryobacterales bacterium]
MQPLLYIDDPAQAAALLQPLRLDLLKRMGEPTSCPELAHQLGVPTQQVNYHMRILAEAGLVCKIDERRVRGTVEGIYQARASSYWLSAKLVGRIGLPRTESELSLGYLLSLAEDLQHDIANLASEDDPPASLGLSMNLELNDPARREAFLKDVQRLFQTLARKYGATEQTRKRKTQPYKLTLACYRQPEQGPQK